MHLKRMTETLIAVSMFVVAASSAQAEDWLAKAVEAAKKIDLKDERFPNRGLHQGYLLFEASCLANDRKSPAARQWLKVAHEQIEGYRGTGSKLVPILLPLFEADRLGEPPDPNQLEELRTILSTERDGELWLTHFLNSMGPVSPKVSAALLLQLPETPVREQVLGQQFARLASIHPPAAWEFAENWPERTEPLLKLRRGIWIGQAILLAHERGRVDYPPSMKDRAAEFAQVYFAEAQKQGLGKGPDFRLPMATQVAMTWALLDADAGKDALQRVKDAYRPPMAPPNPGNWLTHWKHRTATQSERLRHLAVLHALDDSDFDAAFDEAIQESFALRELIKEQPPPDELKAEFGGSYRYTSLSAVQSLMFFSRRLAERALEKIEPELTKNDSPIGDEFWLDWVTLNQKSEQQNLAARIRAMSDPYIQGQAYLRLTRWGHETSTP